MAINSCSINAHTINALLCRRNLLAPPLPTPPVLGTNNRNLSVDFARQYPHLTRHVEDDERPLLNFEQPFITVSVELLGAVGSQQLEASTNLDFVVVTDLQIGTQQVDVAVNISDFKVH